MGEQGQTPSAAGAAPPRAARYHGAHRALGVAAYLADGALLIALLFTGWSAGLRDVAERVSPEPAIALLVYALLFGATMKVVSLPFDYAGGFWLEHRYGLSNLTLASWLKDEIKGLLVGGVLGI